MRLRADRVSVPTFALLYIAATALFIEMHADLRVAHGILVYLLLIVGAAAVSGRVYAYVMVVASYLAVDWLFIGSLGAPRALDGILLAGFVCVAAVVSELVVRFRVARDLALERMAEVERLSDEGRRLVAEVARADSRREADQVKNALLASIAHDLRAPLATIRAMAEQHAEAASIADQTQRVTGYLDALLHFVRQDGVLVPTSNVNVAEDLIGAAMRSAASAIEGRDVRIHLPPGAEVLLGDFDFALALRALQNLLENAARYSPAANSIDVELYRAGEKLSITVSDRGPGLAADDLERVFHPLERGVNANTVRGSGLGLAIARTFARAQGGDVRYAPREGGGSVFTLELRNRVM